MQKKKPLILIAAGGTGGHVMPALAVAEYCQKQGFEVHWLGTQKGIESRLVPKHKIPISYISISGLRKKGKKALLKSPLQILRALWQVFRIYRATKPDVVLTMGGFVSGPAGMMAWFMRKPLIVHEQNSIAGMTNKILVNFAKKVLTAYPNVFKDVSHKSLQTGNPLKEIYLENHAPSVSTEPLKILIFGGSQGALKLNQVVPKAIGLFEKNNYPFIWHQAGERFLKETEASYSEQGIKAKCDTFIDDMPTAYHWADIVIARAGALTVAEVAQMGKASILIPYPYAVDDHQTHNARYLSDEGGAVLLQENELSPQKLFELLSELSDSEKRGQMGNIAKSLAKPQATQQVAEQCIKLTQRT